MAAEERWYFAKEDLLNTFSRKCGIDADKELSYRQQAANFIQDMGQRLTVNQLCINTAIVYMHRFYMFHSFSKFHRNAIATCALFLAAKVEEQPRKLEHVIKVGHTCLLRDGGSPLDTKSEAYLEQAQQLVMNENIMLQTLGFDVAIDHPHTHIVKCCQLVRASKDLAQTSYIMATTSLHLTSMCLQYKPTVVACVCIHLACKWANWEIPCSSEGKEWFWYVDKTVTLDLLIDLTAEFLAILDKCPSRLKKKILSTSTGKDGGPSEKRLKQEILNAGSSLLSGFPSATYGERSGSPSLSSKHERVEWTERQDKPVVKLDRAEKTSSTVTSEKLDVPERPDKERSMTDQFEKQERSNDGTIKHGRPEIKTSGLPRIESNPHANKHHLHVTDAHRHGSNQMPLDPKSLNKTEMTASPPLLKTQRQDQFAVGKEARCNLPSPSVTTKRPGKARHRKEVIGSNHMVDVVASGSRVPPGHPNEMKLASPADKPSVKQDMRIASEPPVKHMNSDLRKLRLVVSEAASKSISSRPTKERNNLHPSEESTTTTREQQLPKANIFSDMSSPMVVGNFAVPVGVAPEKRHEKREKHRHREKTKDAASSELSVPVAAPENPRIKLTIAKERLESNGGVATVSPKDTRIKLKLSKEMFSSHPEAEIPKLKIKIPKNKLTPDSLKVSESSRKRNASPLDSLQTPSPKSARMETRLSRKEDSFPNVPQMDIPMERSKNSRHKSSSSGIMGSKRKSSALNNVHRMADVAATAAAARGVYYTTTGPHNRQFLGVVIPPPPSASSSGVPPLPRDPPPPTPPPPPE